LQGTYISGGDDTDAFLIPQWGGVVFFNLKHSPPSKEVKVTLLSSDALLPVFQVT
jgi:hypothetical protein